MIIVGRLLKISHHLHRHLWAGAPLDRWLALGLAFIAALIALHLLPGGLAGAAAIVGFLVLFLLWQSWASHHNYVAFRKERRPILLAPQPVMLRPEDRVPVRATGLFEVEGKEQSFTELQAFFRTFETREHAVMAIVPPSTVLWLGKWPADELGMWYIFFKNTELRRVEAGHLYFGSTRRPALRLRVEQTLPLPTSPLEVWGGYPLGKPKPKKRRQTMYLSFATEEDRQRVLADLLADATHLTHHPEVAGT